MECRPSLLGAVYPGMSPMHGWRPSTPSSVTAGSPIDPPSTIAIKRWCERQCDDARRDCPAYRPTVALHFHPRPGTVLLCDYELGRSSNLREEMSKKRPVVVISQGARREFDPIVVVPLTTSAPTWPDDRHVRIAVGSYDFLRSDADSWAKCEFISSVSGRRLNRLWRPGGYFAPRVSRTDLRSILRATACVLGGVDLLFQA